MEPRGNEREISTGELIAGSLVQLGLMNENINPSMPLTPNEVPPASLTTGVLPLILNVAQASSVPPLLASSVALPVSAGVVSPVPISGVGFGIQRILTAGSVAAPKQKQKASIDALTLLKHDHHLVDELFQAFGRARGSIEKKRIIALKICKELMVHAQIEEEIFYPTCRGRVSEDLLDEAHVEHDSAKFLLVKIIEGSPDEDFYDAKVKVLSEQVLHHAKKEELKMDSMFSQSLLGWI